MLVDGRTVIVPFNFLRPTLSHRIELWQTSIQCWPFGDEIESDEDGIDAFKRENFVAHLLPQFLRHRTNVKFSHQCDSTICGRDPHPLPVDPDENFAYLGAAEHAHAERAMKARAAEFRVESRRAHYSR
jgi:hypothetical protein